MAMILDLVASYLTSAGIAPAGWTLYKSWLPDTPDQAIVLTETGGAPPDAFNYHNASITMQVRIRAARNGYETAKSKWREIFDLVNGYNFDATSGGPGGPLYVYMMALADGPLVFFDATLR